MQLINPNWPAPENVKALSTTRVGGCSQGIYDGLNLGAHVGDKDDAVNVNRATFINALNLSHITHQSSIWLDQVHGTNLVNWDDLTDKPESSPVADGAYTNRIDMPCVVMTADCLPLLLCDKSGEQIAAVHAGWRGMANGILEKAVAEFATEPRNLIAWCGPCISPEHFEVGREVQDQLGGPAAAYRAHTDQDKVYADLAMLAASRLAKVGVQDCYFSNCCTYSDSELFYSYRRDGQTGRMASLIVKVA